MTCTCTQCGSGMYRQTGDVLPTPDADHVYWCDQCGALAKVSPDKTAFGRTRTTWSLPAGKLAAEKEESATSPTRELAIILGLNCHVLEEDMVAILKAFVNERLREVFGEIDAPTGR